MSEEKIKTEDELSKGQEELAPEQLEEISGGSPELGKNPRQG